MQPITRPIPIFAWTTLMRILPPAARRRPAQVFWDTAGLVVAATWTAVAALVWPSAAAGGQEGTWVAFLAIGAGLAALVHAAAILTRRPARPAHAHHQRRRTRRR